MYNLLMSGTGWNPGQDTLGSDRVFEHTSDALVARFKPNGALDIPALTQLPALFTPEFARDAEPARIGRVLQATLQPGSRGMEYRIDYTFDSDIAPIPAVRIKEWAVELGINIKGMELSRTHWAVKEADLFKVLYKRGLGHFPKPKLFSIGDGVVDDDLVAVMMPFAGFDKTAAALKTACEKVGMRYTRVDDIWEDNKIIQDVASLIAKARVVLCDLTGKNPNVFYEMGLAHMLGKEVIMITQSGGDVPFDVQHLRYVKYWGNDEGRAGLTSDVSKRLGDLKTRSA